MTRLLATAAVLLASAVALTPVAGHVADVAGPYYAATPVATPGRTMLITNGTVWKWNTGAYTADKGPQRDAIACEMVARSAGKLATFTAAGRPFDADALARCNARAR